MKTTPRTAAIYCRISQDRAGGGLGVMRQQKSCQELADRLGWTVAAVLSDNDISAYSGRARPGYRQLLAGLKDGKYDGVLAWHPDRLHRSPLELEGFISVIEAAHAPVQTVQSGLIDLSTPSGRMVARQLGAVARYESEHKSARSRAKALADAKAGRVSGGGTRGWGYARDMHIVEAEAEVIREVADLILYKGYSKGMACRWLTEHGHLTPAGRQWRPTTLTKSLCSARLAGWRSHAPGATTQERLYGSPFLARGAWEPILTREQVERLRIRLADVSRAKSRPDAQYLLSGLVVHRGCVGNGRLLGAHKDGKRRYRCSPPAPVGTGCGGPTIAAEPLERDVLVRLADHLADVSGKDLIVEQDTGQVHELMTQLDEVDSAVFEIGEDRDSRIISREVYLARLAILEARKTALRAKLAAVEDQAIQLPPAFTRPQQRGLAVEQFRAETFLKHWEAADHDSRRMLLRRYIDHIGISPAIPGRNHYDADRVRVYFADGTFSTGPRPTQITRIA